MTAYPLVLTEVEKRFALSFKDEGVVLDDKGLSWSYEGRARGKDYGEIEGIRLRRLPTPGADTGQCRIVFKGGNALNVMSWTPAGFPDAGRAKIYRDFVTALHAHLSAADRARIEFTSGFPGSGAWRIKVGYSALAIAALLFVAVPLGLAVYTSAPQGLYLATGGAALWIGLFRKARQGATLIDANRPGPYSPAAVPAALLP